MGEVSNGTVDLVTPGWRGFEEGDLTAASAAFAADGDLAAEAFAAAWAGRALPKLPAARTDLDRLLLALAATLQAGVAVDGAPRSDVAGLDVPERARWLVAMTDLAVAAAGDDWELVNAAADRWSQPSSRPGRRRT